MLAEEVFAELLELAFAVEVGHAREGARRLPTSRSRECVDTVTSGDIMGAWDGQWHLPFRGDNRRYPQALVVPPSGERHYWRG